MRTLVMILVGLVATSPALAHPAGSGMAPGGSGSYTGTSGYYTGGSGYYTGGSGYDTGSSYPSGTGYVPYPGHNGDPFTTYTDTDTDPGTNPATDTDPGTDTVPTTGDTGGKEEAGCACSSSEAGGGWAVLALGLALVARRRR